MLSGLGSVPKASASRSAICRFGLVNQRVEDTLKKTAGETWNRWLSRAM